MRMQNLKIALMTVSRKTTAIGGKSSQWERCRKSAIQKCVG
jgi:hypothetical protein